LERRSKESAVLVELTKVLEELKEELVVGRDVAASDRLTDTAPEIAPLERGEEPDGPHAI
jgi:hypothetical protein